MTNINRSGLILITGILLLLWFGSLGYRDLIDPDEGRYAEIPREMLASGDWVTPRINDLKYFEKPPLQYWTTTLIYSVLGVSNFTSRLWVALFGFVGVLWTAYIASVLYGRQAGIYALLILSSSFLYYGLSHYLTLDLTLSVWLMLGIGSLVLAQRQRDITGKKTAVRNWMLLAWLSLAAAVLTKGLVGLVLPAGTIFLYSVWQRDVQLWRHLHLFKGLAVVLLVSAPWFVIVSMRNSEFLSFFFVHEHFDRYTTNIHHHKEPFYYFLLIFLAGSSPWTFAAVHSLLHPSFNFKKGNSQFDPERLLWVYVVFTFVFFSLSTSKLPSYILPILPATAILAVHRLMRGSLVAWNAAMSVVVAVILLIAAFIPARLASDAIPIAMLLDYRPWVLVAVAGLLVSAALAWFWRTRLYLALPLLALGACIGWQSLLMGFQSVTPARSARITAGEILKLPLKANTVIYMVGEYLPSLPFYLQQPVTIVDAHGELMMGIESEPQKWIEKPEEFVRRWQEDVSAVAVISNKDFDQYQQLGMPMEIIYAGARDKVVVKNVR